MTNHRVKILIKRDFQSPGLWIEKVKISFYPSIPKGSANIIFFFSVGSKNSSNSCPVRPPSKLASLASAFGWPRQIPLAFFKIPCVQGFLALNRREVFDAIVIVPFFLEWWRAWIFPYYPGFQMAQFIWNHPAKHGTLSSWTFHAHSHGTHPLQGRFDFQFSIF